jgi:hypothetical protein
MLSEKALFGVPGGPWSKKEAQEKQKEPHNAT